MASRFTSPFVDVGSGITPSSGALLNFYDKDTYNRRDTFTTADEAVAHDNPVASDSSGVFPAIFIEGDYRVVLTDSAGVQVWEDNQVTNDSNGNNLERITEIEAELADMYDGSGYGLSPSAGADAEHDITLSSGAVADSTFSKMLVLDAPMTKRIDVPWVAGNEDGGFFPAGGVQPDTDYWLVIIEKDSDGSIDVGFDDNINATSIPVGYTKFRSIYRLKTDSSGNIATFYFFADEELREGFTILRSSMSGLVPSNAADADDDISISPGSAMDSTGAKALILRAAITKQLDAAWAAGNNAGGLFSGTAAAFTTYHMFIIEKDSDGSIDAGFDTSLTAANIPAGYTAYRRVFSLITDGFPNIRYFSANERAGGGISVAYDERQNALDTTAPGTSGVLLTLPIPQGVELNAELSAAISAGESTLIIISSFDQADLAPTAEICDLNADGTVTKSKVNMFRKTSTLGQIRYRSSRGTGLAEFFINLIGFTDERI